MGLVGLLSWETYERTSQIPWQVYKGQGKARGIKTRQPGTLPTGGLTAKKHIRGANGPPIFNP